MSIFVPVAPFPPEKPSPERSHWQPRPTNAPRVPQGPPRASKGNKHSPKGLSRASKGLQGPPRASEHEMTGQ